MKQIIAWPVKPISDISELSAKDGSRQIGFPYFISNADGWDLDFINEATNPEILLKQISEGKIYIHYNLNEKEI